MIALVMEGVALHLLGAGAAAEGFSTLTWAYRLSTSWVICSNRARSATFIPAFRMLYISANSTGMCLERWCSGAMGCSCRVESPLCCHNGFWASRQLGHNKL